MKITNKISINLEMCYFKTKKGILLALSGYLKKRKGLFLEFCNLGISMNALLARDVYYYLAIIGLNQ